MSRIGKRSIFLSEQVRITVKDNIINIKGPKGELSQIISDMIILKLEQQNNQNTLIVSTNNDTKKAKQLHGLSRTLINNMIIGVSRGFSKVLEIQGVGYRAQIEGKKLVLNVGYSHPVIINPPINTVLKVESNTNITIEGINKETVGQIAAKIRSIRPPEPYKGKGIKYKDEIIKRKIGKAGK